MGVGLGMHNAAYCRGKAERVRLIARQVSSTAYDDLMQLAQDFDELADDLLRGAIEIRHPELMPPNKD